MSTPAMITNRHRWPHVIAAVGIAVLLIGCPPVRSGREVTRQQYGDAWPFTVDRVILDCDAGGRAIVKTRSPDVTGTWGLTGAARTYGYPGVDHMWRDNPAIPGTKVPLTEMIRLALQQCR